MSNVPSLVIGGWFFLTLLLPFMVGGMTILSSVSPIRQWYQGVTVYDLVGSFGFAYSVLMSLTAIMLGFYNDAKNKISQILIFLGVLILIAVLVGRFLVFFLE